MIHSLVKEMFTAHLEKLSDLSTKYIKRSGMWMTESKEWLKEAETLMSRFRFPEGSIIAVARGNIAKIEDSSYEENRRQVARKLRASTQEAVESAAKVLNARALESEEVLGSFEKKLCEGLTAYMLVNDTQIFPDADFWKKLKNYEPTKALIIYVEASLVSHDRYYILGKICERVNK